MIPEGAADLPSSRRFEHAAVPQVVAIPLGARVPEKVMDAP